MTNFPNPKKKTCLWCNKFNENLKFCGKCKDAGYCSVECQKNHWSNHKQLCFLEKPIQQKNNIFISDLFKIVSQIQEDTLKQVPSEFFHNIIEKRENNFGEKIITLSSEKNSSIDPSTYDKTAKNEQESIESFKRVTWQILLNFLPKIFSHALFVWLKFNRANLIIEGKNVLNIEQRRTIVPPKFVWKYKYSDDEDYDDEADEDDEYHMWICFKTEGYKTNPRENCYYWDFSAEKYGYFDCGKRLSFGLSCDFWKNSKVYVDSEIEKDKYDMNISYYRIIEFLEVTTFSQSMKSILYKNYKKMFFQSLRYLCSFGNDESILNILGKYDLK